MHPTQFADRLPGFDAIPLRRKFVEQGDFLYLENFLPPEVTAELVAAVSSVGGAVNRNYLPGHKQGGSVGRHLIDELSPFIAELYRSAALIAWLGELFGRALAAVARGGSACLRTIFLHARRRSHRLALRHILLSRPSFHLVAGRDRRFVVPLGTTNCTPATRTLRRSPGPSGIRQEGWYSSTETDCVTA